PPARHQRRCQREEGGGFRFAGPFPPAASLIEEGPHRMSHAATAHAHTDAHPATPEGVALRHDWTVEEIQEIHDAPLLELVYRAQTIHRQVWMDNKVQLSSLPPVLIDSSELSWSCLSFRHWRGMVFARYASSSGGAACIHRSSTHGLCGASGTALV